MKVAYIFSSQGHTVSYKLGKMILPQLEEDRHGVQVVGMFFFEDNNYVLVKGDPIGERLAADDWMTYAPIWLAVGILAVEGVVTLRRQASRSGRSIPAHARRHREAALSQPNGPIQTGQTNVDSIL